LPSDFGDDLSVMVVGKNRIFASPIYPFTSKNDYYAIVGTRNLSYLNSRYYPSIPYVYHIATPHLCGRTTLGLLPREKKTCCR
jgi:hypothetical protein